MPQISHKLRAEVRFPKLIPFQISFKSLLLTAILITVFSSVSNAQFFSQNDSLLRPNKKFRINYELLKQNNSGGNYSNETYKCQIKPTESAIVIIDIWDESFLKSMTKQFINPLITEANRLGMHIIYAPSQKKQNKYIKQLDNSAVFYHLDTMDEYIHSNNIKNLFYVGFDALYCVLDKPNGIYSFQSRCRNQKMKYFAFEKGLTSYTREMKATALSVYKKNNIGVITTPMINYEQIYPRKTERKTYSSVSKKLRGKSFILIFKPNTPDKQLEQFITNLKKAKLPYAEVIGDKLYYKDKTLSYTHEFLHLLIQLKIKNLCYAGYHINNEILWNKYGLTSMYIKKRYAEIEQNPKLYVISDLVFETNTLEANPIREKTVIINHYRNIGNITSSNLLRTK